MFSNLHLITAALALTLLIASAGTQSPELDFRLAVQGETSNITLREALNTLTGRGGAATLRTSAITQTPATEESPAFPLVIYEGWREEGRFGVAQRNNQDDSTDTASWNTISPAWIPNENPERFSWEPDGLTVREAIYTLDMAREDLVCSIHEDTGIVSVIREQLLSNPAWPLNHVLPERAASPLTFEDAIDVLQSECGLVYIGMPEIRWPEDPTLPVWNPTEHDDDATVRDLIFEIYATVGVYRGWHGAFVHTSELDPSDPEEFLSHAVDIPWSFQSGR